MGCGASKEKEGTSSGSKRQRHAGSSKHRSATDDSDSQDNSQSHITSKGGTVNRQIPATNFKDVDDDNDFDDTQSTLSSIVSSDLEADCFGGNQFAFSKMKSLDEQRDDAAVNFDDEFFVWDDANVNIKQSMSARKSMRPTGHKGPGAAPGPRAPAANPLGGSGRGVAPGAAGEAFVFNDFTVDIELNALSESAPAPKISAAAAAATLQHEEMKKTLAAQREAAPVVRREPMPHVDHTGEIRSYELTTLIGHSSRVKCLAVAPGEREYISCSNEDSIVAYYDLRTGQELGIFSGHQDTVIYAIFSPCGKFLATSSRDNTLMLWDVVTQKAILTFEHSKVVICACFSRDSKFIATGCQDKVCRLWETRKGRELLAFTQHEGIIISLSFSPDEAYVVSASADKTLRMWSTAKGKSRAVMRGHTAIILSCQYTVDGRHIVSNDERLTKVWNAADAVCTMTLNVDDFVAIRNMLPTKKLSWTLSCAAPGKFANYLIVACNNRFVFIIDIRTGKEELSVDTKAPVYCLTSGHAHVVAFGDSFGNVYKLRLNGFADDEDDDNAPAMAGAS
jgi:WD40 repeat protein